MRVRKQRRPSALVDPVSINFIVERPMREALDFLAADKGITRNELMRRVMDEHLAKPIRVGAEMEEGD